MSIWCFTQMFSFGHTNLVPFAYFFLVDCLLLACKKSASLCRLFVHMLTISNFSIKRRRGRAIKTKKSAPSCREPNVPEKRRRKRGDMKKVKQIHAYDEIYCLGGILCLFRMSRCVSLRQTRAFSTLFLVSHCFEIHFLFRL